MEAPHRVFVAAKPYVPARRRRAIVRAICVRKYGFTPAELAKAKKRRDKKIAAEVGDDGVEDAVEEEEEDGGGEALVDEAELARDDEEIAATEAAVAVRGRPRPVGARGL
jgi:hypothetical protein